MTYMELVHVAEFIYDCGQSELYTFVYGMFKQGGRIL